MRQSPTTTSWRGVAAGVLISAGAAFQQFKLPPVLPDFLSRHPVEPWIAAFYMSVFALIGLAASKPLGRWLDRVGLPLALLCSAILFACGCALGLVWPEIWEIFLAGRALESVGFAISAIAGPVVAARSAHPRDLALVTGLLAGWVPMGQILASALVAWQPDWRFLWMVGMLAALAMGVVSARFLAGNGMSASAPSRAERSGSPDRRLLRHWIGAAIFMTWSIQYMAFATWLPNLAALRFGLDLRAGTGAYVLPAVFVLIFNVLAGWAIGRGVALLKLLAFALVLQALVWILGPFAGNAGALALLVVYGIGAGIAPACLFHLPHFIEGGRGGASAFGILMTGRNLGGFLGPLLFPVLVDLGAEPPFGLIWFAAILAPALILVGLLARSGAGDQGTSR